MGEVNLGDLTAYIKADLSHFQRGMQEVLRQLGQLQQRGEQQRPVVVAVDQTRLAQALQQAQQAFTQFQQRLQGSTHLHLTLDLTGFQESLRTARQALTQFQQQAQQTISTRATAPAEAPLAQGPRTAALEQRQAAQEAVQRARQAAQEQATLDRQAAQSARQAGQERLLALRQAAQEAAQIMRQAAQAQAQADRATAQSARQAAQAQAQASRQAFQGQMQAQRAALQQSAQAMRQHALELQSERNEIARSNQALRERQQALREAAQASQVSTGGGGLASALQIAGGLGIATTLTAVVAGLKNATTESVRLATTFEGLQRALTAVEGSSQAANQTLARLFATSQRLGVDFQTAATSFKSFEAAAQGTTLAGDGVIQVFTQIQQGSRVLGLSTQQLNSAILALSQIMSKGRLSAEELNQQLAEHVPIARAGIAQNLGITTQALTRMTEAGLIPASTAVLAFGQAMANLGQSTNVQVVDTLAATFTRLKNETTAWMTAIGEGVGTIITPFIRELIRLSETLRDLFNIRPPGVSGGAQSRWAEPQAPPSLTQEMANLNPLSLARRWGQHQQRMQKASADIEALIGFWSTYRGLSPDLIRAMAQQESGLDPTKIGPLIRAGALVGDRAYGLMQIMGTTGAGYGKSLTELKDASTSLEVGTQHLTRDIQQITEAFGNLEDVVPLALAAYNAGLGHVRRGLETLQAQNKPLTWENLAALPKNLGLPQPQQTIPYVRNIMRMFEEFQQGTRPVPGGAPGTAPAPTAPTTAGAAATVQAMAGGLSETILTDLVANIQRTLEELPKIQVEFDAVVASGLNRAGILDKALRQQAERATESFGRVAGLLAQIPGLLERLTPVQREQLALASEQVAVFQQRVDLLLDNPELELVKRQVEQLEQLRLKREADVLTQQKGQAAAERFLETQQEALAIRQLAERQQMALLPPEQQLARYKDRLAELRTEAGLLSIELQQLQAQQALPQFEAQLGQVEQFLGRPLQSAAEQARQAVLQQGLDMRRTLEGLLTSLRQHPWIERLGQDILARIETAFEQLPGIVELAGAKAAAAVDTQMRAQLRTTGDELDQLRLRLGAAGLSPLEADIARLGREYDAMRDKLLALQAQLERTRPTATPAVQQEIDTQLSLIEGLLPRIQPGLEAAEEERRAREGKEVLDRLRNQLEQMQAPARGRDVPWEESREQVKMRQAAATAQLTEAQQAQYEHLARQVQQQRELNYVLDLYYSLADGIGSAWTSALSSIADGTRTVSEAFRAMGQSILKTMADIAAQQAFQAIFKLGAGILTGALGSGQVGFGQGSDFDAALRNTVPLARVPMQHGGIVNRPTLALMGENPAHNPEYVLNRSQMSNLLSSQLRSGPPPGGQTVSVSNHFYPDKARAESGAAQARAMGQVAVTAVIEDMARGESSRINRLSRALQR